jgi:glycosyltransferase involved in cell wall biosynthesis
MVVKTYASVKGAHPDVRLVLVGDGPMRAELQARHADIIFAGFRTGADLARHYASADIFLFASKTETFGNVTLEAMASGLAVVAFDHAAAGEIIRTGVNGILADPASESSFVMGAQTLLNAPDTLRSVAQAGYESARAMGWPAIIESTEAVFARVLEGFAPVDA